MMLKTGQYNVKVKSKAKTRSKYATELPISPGTVFHSENWPDCWAVGSKRLGHKKSEIFLVKIYGWSRKHNVLCIFSYYYF